MKTITIVLGLILNVSCGKSSSDDSSQGPRKDPPTDNGGGKTDAQLTGEWFGIVTKCLTDAEEVTISGSIIVKQKIACSPVMSGKDQNDVTKKLDEWKKQSCSDSIQIKNGTPGNWQGCWIVPYGPQNAVSNTKAPADEKAGAVEFCSGKQGANYGSIRCS